MSEQEHTVPCSQEDAIRHLVDSNNKLSVIITGNGDPEKGLCRHVAIMGERQLGVLKKLDDITKSLTEFHEKTEKNAKAAATAISAIEKYKLESESYSKGIEVEKEQKRVAEALAARQAKDKWQKVFWVIGAIVGLVSIWVAVYFGIRNNEQSAANGAKIENLGTPVTVSRGQIVPLPPGDTIKFYRDGQFKDSMK
jgi:hypothetical protein